MAKKSKHSPSSERFGEKSLEDIRREAQEAGVDLAKPWGARPPRRLSARPEIIHKYERLALNIQRFLALASFEMWEDGPTAKTARRFAFAGLLGIRSHLSRTVGEKPAEDDPLYKAACTGSHRIFRDELIKQSPLLERLIPEIAQRGWAFWTGDDADMLGKYGISPDYDIEMTALPNSLLSAQPSVVRSLEEVDLLIEYRLRGDQVKLDGWLEMRQREIKKWWKRKLRVPAHRIAKQWDLAKYSEAARLRVQEHHTWTKVARMVDPTGFKTNHRQSIERIRKGVSACRRELLRIYELGNLPRKGTTQFS